jgi:hypothetical protein
MIAKTRNSFRFSAMNAAKNSSMRFYAMTYDSGLAMKALGSKHVDSAFKAVKVISFLRHRHLKGLFIFISTVFTLRHVFFPPDMIRFPSTNVGKTLLESLLEDKGNKKPEANFAGFDNGGVLWAFFESWR